MIREVWLLPVIFVLACEQDVPQVDDPNKIVIKGEEMSQTDFLNKYCTEKENHSTCSKVMDAAVQNMIDKARSRKLY